MPQIVENMRKTILSCGGEFLFDKKLSELIIEDNKIAGAKTDDGMIIKANALILATGHSAHDIYEMLNKQGIELESKGFAMGVRVEHPQTLIDSIQYHTKNRSEYLTAASYSLVEQVNGRGVYSFCMCPGGMVVGATSEENQVVTNGMSNYQRNSGIANSAIIVTVNTDDFGGNVLDGISFQRKYEKLAFEVGGENYNAPMQTVGDFLNNNVGSTDFLVKPTYLPGVKSADLRDCLPKFVTTTIAKALPYFGQKIKGFDAPNVVMTGVETRTSAPVRIVRNKELVSLNTKGLYPTGEGAGYAGGIMSAVFDGMIVAIKIIN